MIIVCKKYYIDTLVKELGINNVNINNPTHIPIDDSFETIVKSHNQFITSVGLEMSEEDQNLTYLYWTPKLHKSPYSTLDTCKNCAKCGKGFKIGTNEAYNIKIKIRLRGISKILCFCSHANIAATKL